MTDRPPGPWSALTRLRGGERTPFGQVVRQAGTLALGRGLGSALAIPRLALVAQVFGAAAFGRYSLLTAFSAIGVVLVEFGMKTAAPRRAAGQPEVARGLTLQILILQGSLALLVAAGCVLSGLTRLAETAFVLAFLLGPAITSAGVLRRGLGDARLEARLDTTLSVARLVPTLAALFLPLDLDEVYGWTLVATLAVVPLSRLVTAVGTRPAVAWRPLLREGSTLLMAGLASQLFGRVDLLVLAAFTDDLEVARYSAPAVLLQALGLGAIALGSTAIPWLVGLREERGGAEMLAVALRRSWAVVAVTAALALVAAALAPVVLPVVLDLEVSPAVAWPVILSSAPAAGSYWLFMTLAAAERPRLFIYAIAVTLVANLAFDLAVIPRFGAEGAAWGTLLSELTLYLLALQVARRTASFRKSVV